MPYLSLAKLQWLSNRTTKRNKRDPDHKGRSKTISAHDIILSMENLKESTHKKLELIKFSKVARFNIGIQIAVTRTSSKC